MNSLNVAVTLLPMATLVADAPGPRARIRNRIFNVVTALVIALVIWVGAAQAVQAAERLEFERAARYRDRLTAVLVSGRRGTR